MKQKELIHTLEIPVRFSEVDSMGIVWHGNFIKYLEDGREAFGQAYGIHYMKMYGQGYMVPLVHIDCQYKKYVRYGQKLLVETRFVNQQAAKIVFHYTVRLQQSGEVVAEAKTIQVFVTHEGELVLTMPVFFDEWKTQYGLKRL